MSQIGSGASEGPSHMSFDIIDAHSVKYYILARVHVSRHDETMSTVQFVLLDDTVLVARQCHRSNTSESNKLVAYRCWPLNEMLASVLDMKDTAGVYF